MSSNTLRDNGCSIEDRMHYGRLEIYHIEDMIERKEQELIQCRKALEEAKTKYENMIKEYQSSKVIHL